MLDQQNNKTEHRMSSTTHQHPDHSASTQQNNSDDLNNSGANTSAPDVVSLNEQHSEHHDKHHYSKHSAHTILAELRTKIKKVKEEGKVTIKKMEKTLGLAHDNDKNDYSGLDEHQIALKRARHERLQHQEATAIHGSVANMLPMLDDSGVPDDQETYVSDELTSSAAASADADHPKVSLDSASDTSTTASLGELKINSADTTPPPKARGRTSSDVDAKDVDVTDEDYQFPSASPRSQSTADRSEAYPNLHPLAHSVSDTSLRPQDGHSPPRNKIKDILSQTNSKVKRMIRLTRNMSRTKLSQNDSDDMFGGIHIPTPGELRLRVLEWMYDERGNECNALKRENFAMFEDLVPVFVSVVLHSSSNIVRNRVLRFLLDCAGESTHFAFLIISNIYALQDNEAEMAAAAKTAVAAAASSTATDNGGTYRNINQNVYLNQLTNSAIPKQTSITPASPTKGTPRASDLEKLETAMNVVRTTFESSTGSTRSDLDNVMHILQDVHDSHLVGRLYSGPTRANINMLVDEIRKGVARVGGEAMLADLDGKLSFVNSLTALDDWLIRSCAREERHEAVRRKLQSLNDTLGFGAYLPTAVNSVGTGHKVLRLAVEETIVFNTARKCPFLLVAEVESSEDALHQSRKESGEWMDGRQSAASLEIDMKARGFSFESNDSDSLRGAHSGSIELVNKDASSSLSGNEEDDMMIESTSKRKDDKAIRIDQDQRNDGNYEVSAANKSGPETWEQTVERVREASPHGQNPRWGLAAMFVKAGDDLRQQQLGVLLVSTFQKIFREESVPVWLAPYRVCATGPSSGLLEPVRNADSIARLKERGSYYYLDEYFSDTYGAADSVRFKVAQHNFLASLAGYSIVAYLIKLHDRHNGNILVDSEGHYLAIDFGFMLGHYHNLERSPFKLTKGMVRVLGGARSKQFQKFRRLMEKAYIAASKHEREIVLLVDLMSVGSPSPCFAGGRRWVIDELRGRLNPGYSTRQLRVHINDMIDWSLGNLSSRCYDKYQRCVNGIW